MAISETEKNINKPFNYVKAKTYGAENYYAKNISGQDFSSALLPQSNFSHCIANICRFTNTKLEDADFSFSDLKNSNFNGANLKNTNFHFAQLEDCDLSTAINLNETQFSGAKLSYCKLPADFDFPTLNYVQEAAKHLTVNLFAIFFTCLYSWIAIGSTTDIDLLNDTKSIFFPLLEMSLPTVGFYYISPVVLLVITLVFNFQLSLYWYRLSCLPSYFPDGSSITLKTYPTLIDNMVEQYFPFIRSNYQSLSQKLKLYLTLIILFFVTPATLIAYWLRYIPKHDYIGSMIHSSLILICICFSFVTWHKIKSTAKLDHNNSFPYKRFIATIAILGCVMFSISLGITTSLKFPITSMYLDVSFQKLTQSTESKSTQRIRQSTKKINEYGFILDDQNLYRANMFHINLQYGSLINTILSHTDLRKADLSNSEMKQADFTYARLDNAIMRNVSAIRANFDHAQLDLTDMNNSIFSQGSFISSNLIRASMLSSDFSRSNFTNSKLDFVNASKANFSMAIIRDVSLNKAKLQHANFYLAQLNNSYFWRADLTSATLILANCTYANFTDANLTKANLAQSILNNATFNNAVMDEANLNFAKLNMTSLVNTSLKGADLSNAQLQNANLTGSNLTGVNFSNAWLENTILIKADLRGALNLTAKQLQQAVIDNTTQLPPQFNYMLLKQVNKDNNISKGVH